jgi:hypothetical protein
VWELRSLGYRTDLTLVAFDGQVDDRERYVVVRTPSNPDFWWGNFILYPEAPTDRSWLEDLEREFPGAGSHLLAWDRPDGEAGAAELYVPDGFEIDESAILSATRESIHRSPRWNDDVVIHPIENETQWVLAEHALTAAFAVNGRGTLEEQRLFVERQLGRYRAMQAKGVGQWFTAHLDGEVAGALGVVRQGDIGRFQLVGTDPRFGRRGVCSTLVYSAARTALEEMGLHTLVMAADATYHAARVYESVGFERTERLIALIRRPPRST